MIFFIGLIVAILAWVINANLPVVYWDPRCLILFYIGCLMMIVSIGILCWRHLP